MTKIAVVGGFRGFENDPQSNDYKFVMPALEYLRASCISVSDNPIFDTINFENNRNFLDEDHQYDAVFISHVPNGRNTSWTRMSFNHFSGTRNVDERNALANTIDSKNSPQRWSDRIRRSNAKIVMTVGGWIEVDQHFLMECENFSQIYESMIAPKNDVSLVGVGDVFEKDKLSQIYADKVDVPYQWLGISVSRDFLRGKPQRKSDTTYLSRQIQPRRLVA
jgi:hypothetical protein